MTLNMAIASFGFFRHLRAVVCKDAIWMSWT